MFNTETQILLQNVFNWKITFLLKHLIHPKINIKYNFNIEFIFYWFGEENILNYKWIFFN